MSGQVHWQPSLTGALIRLRPLAESDFEALYSVGSDPLIWDQHPERDRYKREKFAKYFQSGIESGGALAVIDQKTGNLIGSSRFSNYDPTMSSIEVGYTFLSRPCWGKGHNRELKLLMLNYAYRIVNHVFFFVGAMNQRSQKAIMGIGASELKRIPRSPAQGGSYDAILYQLRKEEWASRVAAIAPPFEQPALTTSRLILEPVAEAHAEELWDLFRDPELHRFVPFDPISLEKVRERCARWAKRRSPDGNELWINWVGRERASGQVIAHFQAGAQADGTGSIGYLVARSHQSKGFSTEALQVVFAYLRDQLGVREVKAWTDTRNVASHRLARKLGMVQVDFIKDADFFKGTSSDEYVFSRVFE